MQILLSYLGFKIYFSILCLKYEQGIEVSHGANIIMSVNLILMSGHHVSPPQFCNDYHGTDIYYFS